MRVAVPFLCVLTLSVGACASPKASTRPVTTAAHAEGAPRAPLAWGTFSPETFKRARAEGKYVVLDGSAEWCHWCHVMEATTYHDPAVRKILDAHFIAVKVDVDARPDIEERYGDWGWPATVIFAPDATELGKHRGYIAPDKFAQILSEVVASGAKDQRANAAAGEATKVAPKTPLAEEQLAWIQHAVDVELDDYWDEKRGGWGRTQKAPLGWDNAWMLRKAEQGDAEARQKALFTLDAQSKLIDPVWGGIYQYSAASDWDHAHFEKLMTFQAPALDNYATAYKLAREPRQLERAKKMLAYIDRFMKGPEGGFYTTQDADLNAHDASKPFMTGHEYYALDEARRLARGVPRIDKNEYGRENGLAIAAYTTMYEVTKDAAVLASAERAAERVWDTHATSRGGITHGPVPAAERDRARLYLSDNAAFAFGLARLYEATAKAVYLERAERLAELMITELTDERGGGFFGHTKDDDAVGVFAVRRVPFEDNVMAVRALSKLARATNKPAYSGAIDRVLRAISTPEEIKARGRMLGDYLLALDESKDVRGK
ncbi:MAG: thioredoxin domain-containing protein [Myxococcales bacterium]|nr:thioredoxin domain-containing protein [Myxococcales bacterium]